MRSRADRIQFSGAFGDRLAARLERPVASPKAFALFAHCFTCSKDLRSVRQLSQGLVAAGIAVLRFDFTGLGESEGDFADTNFSSNLDDLVAAADYLRQEHRAPELLIGHSLGGAAVLKVAARIPESRAVATLGAPSDPQHLRSSVLASADLEDREEAEVSIGGRPFVVKRQLLADLAEHDLLTDLGRLRRSLLVLHSPVDEIVGVDHARRIFDAARHPKSFVTLDGADHLLLRNADDARYAGDILACWARRYVSSQPVQAEDSGDTPSLERGEVEVRGGASLAQTVRTARHSFAADEPVEVGGGDTGPNPYELLLAALGTCTSMTLRLYADRKGWPLEQTIVRLRHDRIHARDCEDCETAEGRVDRIERTLDLVGELDETQQQRLREIAVRCPVHRTLTTETKIRDVS